MTAEFPDPAPLGRLEPLPPLDPSAATRILAVRLDNIGDVVLLGPALRALRAAAPRATITLLCSRAGREAAALLPDVDSTIVARPAWQDLGGRLPLDPDRELGLVAELRAGGFDAAFVFTSFSQTAFAPAFACYLAGIPVRVGQVREFGGSLLTHAVPSAPDGVHQADRNLFLLESVGITAADRSLAVALPNAGVAGADAQLRAAGIDPRAPFVVVAPGASAQARRYPAEAFGAIVRGLSDATGWPAVIVGSAADGEAAASIRSLAPDAVSLVGDTSTAEWGAIIGAARLLVTSHSAPIHLADALGTPVVCLFSGTDRETEWAPRATPSVLLREPTPCAPCRLVACPIGTPCLAIPPAAVVTAALRLLGPVVAPATPV